MQAGFEKHRRCPAVQSVCVVESDGEDVMAEEERSLRCVCVPVKELPVKYKTPFGVAEGGLFGEIVYT